MASLIKKIRTSSGDLQIDYNALANLPALNTMFSNPNLLINSDFRNPINQRGQTSYKSDAGNWSRVYTIDRWNMQNGASCTVNEASITLKGNTSQSGTSCFCQIIDGALPADTYTLQVKVKSISNGGAVSVTNSSSQQVFNSNLSTGINTFTISNTTVFFVSIDLGSNSTVELEWIKLEQGSVATPFVPKLYDEELSICRRYYRKYWTSMLFPQFYQNQYIGFYFDTPMRRDPDVGTFSVLSTSNSSSIGQSVEVYAQGVYKFHVTSGYSEKAIIVPMLELDAEIY